MIVVSPGKSAPERFAETAPYFFSGGYGWGPLQEMKHPPIREEVHRTSVLLKLHLKK
jgi:hypothetical protein